MLRILHYVIFLLVAIVNTCYAGWNVPGTNSCVGFGCAGDPYIGGNNDKKNWENTGKTLDTYTSGRNTFEVNIKNKCNKSIWVAVHSQQRNECYPNNCSSVGGGSVGGDKYVWTTNGWWKLPPGQKNFIVKTKNRNIYFAANTSDGTSWGSSDYRWKVRGKLAKFFKQDMGNAFTEYTQNFSCN